MELKKYCENNQIKENLTREELLELKELLGKIKEKELVLEKDNQGEVYQEKINGNKPVN